MYKRWLLLIIIRKILCILWESLWSIVKMVKCMYFVVQRDQYNYLWLRPQCSVTKCVHLSYQILALPRVNSVSVTQTTEQRASEPSGPLLACTVSTIVILCVVYVRIGAMGLCVYTNPLKGKCIYIHTYIHACTCTCNIHTYGYACILYISTCWLLCP